MKNEFYSINDMYQMIRAFYIANFPHEIDFEVEDVLNSMIHKHNSKASVGKVGNDYLFDNPEPTRECDDIFFDASNEYKISLETYYSQKENIVKIFNDVNAFHQWLINEGFVKNFMATEKMLDIKSL